MATFKTAGINAGTAADIALRVVAGRIVNTVLPLGRASMAEDAVAFTGGILNYPNKFVITGATKDHDDKTIMGNAQEGLNQLLATVVADGIKNYLFMNKKATFSLNRTIHLYLSITVALLAKSNGVAYFPAAVTAGWRQNDTLVKARSGLN